MGYVDENLMTGERVVYQTRLHWITFGGPGFLAFLVFWLGVLVANSPEMGGAGLGFFVILVAVIIIGVAVIRYFTSEFAVTDKRLMIKVGWLRRHTLETLLTKVENIGVDQSISGRILGFGTLSITGTGGTKEQFKTISSPMAFRKYVQEQIAAAQDTGSHQVVTDSGGARVSVGHPREERECPYCAEIILAKARVCKHCGREVEGQ